MNSNDRVVVDVGNTTVAFAISQNEEVIFPTRIATEEIQDSSDFVARITKLFEDSGVKPGAIVACVGVERLRSELYEAATSLDMEINLLSGRKSGGVIVNYDTPDTLGPDRVANAIAASYLVPLPGLVVDCGTAINIDYIDENGAFTGGAILPGIETARNSLTAHAPNLPKVDLNVSEGFFGTNTTTCIQSGVLHGAAFAIDAYIYKARKYHGVEQVILTGGNAETILPLLSEDVIFNEWFTLGGLALAKID